MIGIFGGSFDPPHIGHKNVIQNFWKNFPNAKKLFIVPNKISPFKNLKNAKLSEILDMLKILLSGIGNPKTEICDYELHKRGKSFSIDTIRYFKKKFPKESLFFLIGEDNLENFHLWKEPNKILDFTTILVFRRNPGILLNKLNKFEKNPKVKNSCYGSSKILFLDNKKIPCSSSEIRNLLENQSSTATERKKLQYLLGKDVFNYIQLKNIYTKKK